jgi:hypothetical protein
MEYVHRRASVREDPSRSVAKFALSSTGASQMIHGDQAQGFFENEWRASLVA